MGFRNPIKVTTADLADGSVTTPKIADLAVKRAKIDNLAVGTAQVDDLAVTRAKIGNLAVGTAQVDDLAVTRAKIANLAVGTAQVDDLAVTRAKIVNLAVGTAQVDNAAITDAKINDLDAGKITGGTITATISIDGPVITGGILRTASSGQRVEINSSSINVVTLYTGNVNELIPAKIQSNSGGSMTIQGPTLTGGATSTFQFNSGGLNIDASGGAIQITATNGVTITPPTWHLLSPLYNASWEDFETAHPGTGFTGGRYVRDAQDFVTVEGLLIWVGAGTGAAQTIATLPAGYRPAARLIFYLGCTSDAIARVDVLPNGDVIFNTGDATGWANLTGIRFSTH